MKKKIICVILLLIPVAVSIYSLIVFVQSATVWSEQINIEVQSAGYYTETAREFRSYLIGNIVMVCACVASIISCVVVAVLIFKKDLVATGSSIVDQWHTYKQARADKKAAKSAEQKQARIAELEQELEHLKKNE